MAIPRFNPCCDRTGTTLAATGFVRHLLRSCCDRTGHALSHLYRAAAVSLLSINPLCTQSSSFSGSSSFTVLASE